MVPTHTRKNTGELLSRQPLTPVRFTLHKTSKFTRHRLLKPFITIQFSQVTRYQALALFYSFVVCPLMAPHGIGCSSPFDLRQPIRSVNPSPAIERGASFMVNLESP